ncbi:MAG: DUF4920 domain-containing protein [Marinicella sp.]|nr:DUF4920 domain-containing protein [Xanthomonadales bacterium]
MIKKTKLLFVLLCMNFMVNAASMQGQPAPSFNLQDQDGQVHQLSDYAGKWLVVYFYPKDDTTGCTIEAKAFRDNYETLKSMNAEVLGVSLDDAESHQAFIKKYQLPFNLLVDENKNMSRDYGVDGGMAFFSYAKRQTFIINPQGMIDRHFEDVDPSSHYDEVYTALEGLQTVHASQGGKNESKIKPSEVTDSYTVYGDAWNYADVSSNNIAVVLTEPNSYLTDNSIITGRITRVCQKQGCWMILADNKAGESFARVDFNDHAFLIPKDSSGDAEVYGKLVTKELTAEQKAHYEAEGAGQLPEISYEIVAYSVKILQ